MRMATTTRTGQDDNPLTLWIEKSGWDELPPIGTQVCAIGPGGWKYYGTVIETKADGSYIIGKVAAANHILDNIRQWAA